MDKNPDEATTKEEASHVVGYSNLSAANFESFVSRAISDSVGAEHHIRPITPEEVRKSYDLVVAGFDSYSLVVFKTERPIINDNMEHATNSALLINKAAKSSLEITLRAAEVTCSVWDIPVE